MDMSKRLYQDALVRSGIQTPLQDLRYEREDVWVAKQILKSANFWEIVAGVSGLMFGLKKIIKWMVDDVE